MIALIGLFKLSAHCNERSIIPILDSCVFSDMFFISNYSFFFK